PATNLGIGQPILNRGGDELSPCEILSVGQGRRTPWRLGNGHPMSWVGDERVAFGFIPFPPLRRIRIAIERKFSANENLIRLREIREESEDVFVHRRAIDGSPLAHARAPNSRRASLAETCSCP